MPFPKEPGFYWAKWRDADPLTRDGDELTPSEKWEPVEVFDNNGEGSEQLRVEVGGVERSQSIENFLWGDKIDPPRNS